MRPLVDARRTGRMAPCVALALLITGCSCSDPPHDERTRSTEAQSALAPSTPSTTPAVAPEPEAEPLPPEVEDFVAAERIARCMHAARCEPIAVLAVTTVASVCHPASPFRHYWSSEERLAALAAGECNFDPEVARACLESYEGTCDGAPFNDICPGFCRGHGDVGDECGGGCSPGLRCQTHCTSPTECRNRCGPFFAEGEECAGIGSCAEGLDCARAADDTMVCVRLPRAWEACDRELEFIGTFMCSQGVWQPMYPGLGEPCLVSCDDESFCSGSSDVARCEARAPLGASCHDDAACSNRGCATYLPCGRGGRCVADVCREIVGPGAACDATRPCLLSFFCERGTCAPMPVLAEPCTEDVGCARGICRAGRCQVRAPGERCAYLYDSAFGSCETGSCPSSGVCGSPREIGEHCSYEDHCSPPAYCSDLLDGVCVLP